MMVAKILAGESGRWR